ncbi:hypothetical protein QF014_001733 [Pantoea agglomerans]|nr:hypothetical protein [Pantoea agglomerans]
MKNKLLISALQFNLLLKLIFMAVVFLIASIVGLACVLDFGVRFFSVFTIYFISSILTISFVFILYLLPVTTLLIYMEYIEGESRCN